MSVRIVTGDCRHALSDMAAGSVHCCVTSPPYWGLRDYGVDGQIGLEDSPEAFVEGMVEVFREARRVLRDDGTLWLNLGDSYASNPASGGPGSQEGGEHQRTPARPYRRPDGLKPKDLIGIPWRVALALQADGWYLRSDIIWAKPNPMPESVTDRPTRSHEYIFLLSKSARYYYDAEAIREPATTEGDLRPTKTFGKSGNSDRNDGGRAYLSGSGRNKRDVWTVTTAPYKDAHFATFPPKLIEPCILAGCPKGGTVLDPFGGAGTTGLVADRLGRDSILIELNEQYAEMARRRIEDDAPLFAEVSSL